MPDAPIFVLVDSGVAAGGDRMVLGLSLAERAELAARRAGFGKVLHIGARASETAPSGWAEFMASPPSGQYSSLAIAPATVLAEEDWLRAEWEGAAIEWAAAPGRLVLVAPAASREALRALDEAGATDFDAVHAALSRRFGPPAALPAAIDPLVVEGSRDQREAERRLMRKLVKDTDGFMARHVERPISLQISRRLAATAITPNQMSLISVAVGLCAGPFFLSPRPLLQTIGALIFLAHSILDGCDGELARLKFQQSRLGGVLDFWGDNVVHVVIFACMAVGWSRAAGAGWPLGLGAAAVLGTLGSAGFVYWRLMRGKDGGSALFTSVSAEPERPLARVLDAASRRDFIYLVIVLALAGKSSWFLLLAAIGAPIYFLLVVLLAFP
jgi:1L-myo-inositol 1-phosphate cytidylyltransferase / CDP-L-myo-inositol myo-inositolphosphotransferase